MAVRWKRDVMQAWKADMSWTAVIKIEAIIDIVTHREAARCCDAGQTHRFIVGTDVEQHGALPYRGAEASAAGDLAQTESRALVR